MSIKTDSAQSNCLPDSNAIADFFDSQLAEWPAAAERYRRLESVVLNRTLTHAKRHLLLTHNSDRAVSSCADTSAAAIAARPCFLCEANRPKQQRGLPLNDDFALFVNPFPIFTPHFTIVSSHHTPQRLDSDIISFMARLATAWPQMTIFYNGPRAGASAPDHMHLQAVPTTSLPIWSDVVEENALGVLRSFYNMASGHLAIKVPRSGLKCIVIDAQTPENMADCIKRIVDITPAVDGPDASYNLYMRSWGEGIRAIFIPRSKHRPASYFTKQTLCSPGAVDMAGCLVLPRRADFDSLDADSAAALLDEVSLADSDYYKLILDIISYE